MLPVFDVTEASFPVEVVEASRETPILVDFWASGCEPCRTLGPLLERLATESNGAFRVARVDTEQELRLAAMFQVQSIPFVVAFVAGQPVDVVAGALDEAKVKAFLGRIGIELPAAPKDEPVPLTTLDTASERIRGRELAAIDEIRESLEAIEEEDDNHGSAVRLLEAWEWFEGEPPGDGEAVALAREARQLWVAGNERGAMETLLASVRADRGWHEELARRASVALMQLHADQTEFVDALRKRLAIELY